ncbi:hypothetical protein GCG54_00015147 [Colletotrichum gloeosporioides]|uniref:Endoglucanase n=1 Tax=Colletotrichum gloeosporioides TaxID=474922 RepID=A0A8H4CDH7_COLGL|nr:uncharacterized protein GCG54_00015147 [Colletotrichum gloeosporioides]KAF3801925.1 hypothetical protein GCG54_00015147 [Colletotrichum gloeosporioides]
MSSLLFTSLFTSLFLSLTSAHVVLENPKPFKFVADGPTNPISSTGDDFPCKVPPGASYIVDGERTVYAVGEPQTATFAGQAVHGGGSCQFALSTDTEPTKQSTWMVIHSIEGGCPARNQKGNLEGPNKDEYTFSIPQGIAPGEYTFAWTWQARVGGQPEYYMNCAPITVVAAKKRRGHARGGWGVSKRQTQFPELFMANMGEVSGGCTTNEALTAQVPIKYPNAGTSVDHPEGEANLFVQPCDGNPRAGAGSGGGGSVEPPAASASASSAAPGEDQPEPTTSYQDTPPAEPTSSEIDTPAVTSPPVVSTTAPERPAPSCAVPAISTVEVTVTVTATITAQVPVASGAPDAPADEDDDENEACTEGYLTCLEDETHFATCTGGELTAPQPIAPGFKCAAGEGEGLDISPIGGY